MQFVIRSPIVPVTVVRLRCCGDPLGAERGALILQLDAETTEQQLNQRLETRVRLQHPGWAGNRIGFQRLLYGR
jgi:hypothetical protein